MQFAIYSNCFDQINAIDATLMSSQNAINASLTNFAKIKIKINIKINKIKELYELNKKNLTRMIS